jgi:Na+-transporting methylmalonyl-CoA/oxaloacetate decarboxylase gamma subunit|tara:strand:- start:8703 stop:8819 length:117 start_codon:yes stop_codon:yes gene_type:complete
MWLIYEVLEAIGLMIIGLAMVYVLMLLIEIKGWGEIKK